MTYPRTGSTSVAIALWLTAVASYATDAADPAAMYAKRAWVAARFEGVEQALPRDLALIEQANYGPVQQNGRGEGPLRIGNNVYERGLYCHADSRLTIRLPALATTFRAVIGVDSNEQTRGGRGSVVFTVRIGNREVYRSDTLREGLAGVPVEVDLEGMREFELRVEDGGDGISCDQADWADACVTLANGNEVWLGNLPLVDNTSGPEARTAPFSFTYNGIPSTDLLETWQVRRSTRPLDDARVEHVAIYTDVETGLVARCVAIEYRDFPTLEWVLHLENTGTADTPLLTDIRPLDITWRRRPGSEFILHHNRGDSCTPDSYEPLATTLTPESEQYFAPLGGRPTSGAWPYWNVQWDRGGVLAALGWPGQWSARFERDGGERLRMCGGQELTHFALRPGEQVRTPLVVLQFYHGDRVTAQNQWRRWMLAHNLPRSHGQLPRPMLTSCSGGFFPGLKCNEADELKFVEAFRRQEIDLDYWWMDAGWYPCEQWPQVGTWEVDRSRFPDGLKPISDFVHAQDMQLILWFEPERVAPQTWLYEHHPQWLLGPEGGQKLLNLGNTEARAWLVEHVDDLITREGIDLYRQDFNMDPLPYWRAADAPDRQGITEIRHVEGYLAYWDELRRRHPGMLIDSCASGGRRNDLETLRRAIPLLRSDYQSFGGDARYALGNQCHTYALSAWLPYHGQGVYYSEDQLVYAVRSHFCPAFGFCTDVRRNDTDWALLRRLTENWRMLAPNFLGDYYPLTPYSLADDAWMAWQFDCPERGEGFVQVFRRRESVYTAARLRLRGLDAEASYELTNVDQPGTTTSTGRELCTAGLPVEIAEQPGAIIITYRRKPSPQ